MAPQTTSHRFSRAFGRSRAWGGPGGVVVVVIVPLTALALFLVFGLVGSWTWSWVFLLLVPIAGIALYGFRGDGPYSE